MQHPTAEVIRYYFFVNVTKHLIVIFLQSGYLVPTSYSLMRRGGSACVTITCTGCGSEVAYPHIIEMLDEVCELGKDDMKALPSENLGSWQCAVTTSDGCWHIRGFFFPRIAHL